MPSDRASQPTQPIRADDPRLAALLTILSAAGALWLAAASLMGASDFWLISICRAALGGGEVSFPDAIAAPEFSLRLLGEAWAMWSLMMAAMMLPAAAGMAGAFTDLARLELKGKGAAGRLALFCGVYLLIWSGFSLIAAAAQLFLRGAAGFSADGSLAGPIAGGALMIIAGAWQFSAVKQACLVKCRQPMTFLMKHWRPGPAGAARLGALHGLYCLGCCAALMALMFVFGAMNLWWMAAITLYCLAEKLIPGALTWSRLAGAAMAGAGAAMIMSQIL